MFELQESRIFFYEFLEYLLGTYWNYVTDIGSYGDLSWKSSMFTDSGGKGNDIFQGRNYFWKVRFLPVRDKTDGI